MPARPRRSATSSPSVTCLEVTSLEVLPVADPGIAAVRHDVDVAGSVPASARARTRASAWSLMKTMGTAEPEASKCRDQDGAGRAKRKTAPRGELGMAHSLPPCASIIDRLMARPMPVPCGLVV